ncbi:hypothetical protein NX059_001942 [Plenodomus lindquistii]|nr:hypothetical protein NX059_001942 [Plenodomus lindquistii]
MHVLPLQPALSTSRVLTCRSLFPLLTSPHNFNLVPTYEIAMARYAVTIVAGERRVSVLIVHSPDELCSALIDTVKLRVASLHHKLALPDATDLQVALHLDTEDGPLIDPEDLLSDVLPGGATETVYAVINIEMPNGSQHEALPPTQPTEAGGALKLRIITPELARSSPTLDSILPLETAVSLECTLKELRGVVQQSLGFPEDDGSCPDLACNCSFARLIDQQACLNDRATEAYDPLNSVIVVYNTNDVAVIPVADLTLNKMQQAAKDCLAKHFEDKVITTVGGIEDPSRRILLDKCYIKVPILAVCSTKQHSKHDVQKSVSGERGDRLPQRELVVDIHTSECPVEITAHNAGVTLAEAGLESCAINGVLNIYAVQRWQSTSPGTVLHGKSGIFKNADAWSHHVGQSDRGTANLLSTLRVFTDLVSGQKMEASRQDAVLHVIRLLTRFPPAVRTTYILMRGETPRFSERAALSQCLYEVLKLAIPVQTIASDPKRFFEGCRLLMGLILEKAKNLKISSDQAQASTLPYISMPVHDLRNQVTMYPILSAPVHTTSGLLDRGFFNAFQANGPLKWTGGRDTTKSTTPDHAWIRMATVAGGTKSQIVRYNADTIESSGRYADGGDINKVISSAEYTDLHYLANLCSRNQLAVVPPSKLALASPPVLTLD